MKTHRLLAVTAAFPVDWLFLVQAVPVHDKVAAGGKSRAANLVSAHCAGSYCPAGD